MYGDNTVHRLISFLVLTQEVTVPAVEYLCRRHFIANSFRRCGDLQEATLSRWRATMWTAGA